MLNSNDHVAERVFQAAAEDFCGEDTAIVIDDLVGIIIWHEGPNVPDGIITVYTTSDVDTGNFGPVQPADMRNLLLALGHNRIKAGLEDFSVTTEATHWSGMVYSGGNTSISSTFT